MAVWLLPATVSTKRISTSWLLKASAAFDNVRHGHATATREDDVPNRATECRGRIIAKICGTTGVTAPRKSG